MNPETYNKVHLLSLPEEEEEKEAKAIRGQS